VVRVERQDLTREVTLAGSVEPVRSIEVNSRAAGTVLTVRVQEGDRVRQGQLMLELDARETAAQLERARAVLANAEAAFRRSEEMHRAAIITSAEFEQAQAAFHTAKSDVDLWETRLDFTRVRAPSTGVVTAKLIEAGSAVNPNQRLFDIADDALMVVRVQMSELDVVHVQERDVVRLTLDAHPDAVLRGSIRRIFPSADPTTRLLPVLVIPAAAVGASTTGPFAYLVEADTLVRRPITVGLTSSGMVEVSSGIEPGALVVTSGHLGLRAGVTVRIMNRAALSPDGGEEIRNP
jgi:RND family efflux transporter MFP subunit